MHDFFVHSPSTASATSWTYRIYARKYQNTVIWTDEVSLFKYISIKKYAHFYDGAISFVFIIIFGLEFGLFLAMDTIAFR